MKMHPAVYRGCDYGDDEAPEELASHARKVRMIESAKSGTPVRGRAFKRMAKKLIRRPRG